MDADTLLPLLSEVVLLDGVVFTDRHGANTINMDRGITRVE